MIKRFNEWLLENKKPEPKDPQTYDEVKALLDKWEVENYTINDDLSVDVKGSVRINKKLKDSGFNHIPIKFRNIESIFNVLNNDLTSLKGLHENFTCKELYYGNNNISSLEGLPTKSKMDVICIYNKGANSYILNKLAKFMIKYDIDWKSAIIKYIDEIPDDTWSHLTIKGKPLPSKEEFKKKYMGAIASKRLGL